MAARHSSCAVGNDRLAAFVRRIRGRARTLEALVLVSAATVAQEWVPMTRWSLLLGRHGSVPAEWRGEAVVRLPSRTATLTESRVARSVRRASQLLPWEPTCLAEATAAQIMLRERGEAGVVVIGLRCPEPADDAAGSHWEAHAWLLGRGGAVIGGPAALGFTATTVFVPPRAPSPETLTY